MRRFAILLVLVLGLMTAVGHAQQIYYQTSCNHSVTIQMTTATTTQLVALAAGQQVRVCAYAIQGSLSVTATTISLVYGTGAACATGTTALTPAWALPASSTALPFREGDGIGELMQTPAGNALCATNSAAGTVNIRVTYAQF